MAFCDPHTNDEYVDGQKRRFKLETLYLILFLAGVNVLQGIIRGDIADHVIACGVLLFIAAIYYMLRDAFTGIEHPNIATEKETSYAEIDDVLISYLCRYNYW